MFCRRRIYFIFHIHDERRALIFTAGKCHRQSRVCLFVAYLATLSVAQNIKGKVHPRTGHEGPEGE